MTKTRAVPARAGPKPHTVLLHAVLSMHAVQSSAFTFFTVLSATSPTSTSRRPSIVLLPASTCPATTRFTTAFPCARAASSAWRSLRDLAPRPGAWVAAAAVADGDDDDAAAAAVDGPAEDGAGLAAGDGTLGGRKVTRKGGRARGRESRGDGSVPMVSSNEPSFGFRPPDVGRVVGAR